MRPPAGLTATGPPQSTAAWATFESATDARDTSRTVTEEFDHGHDPKAEEAALHQRFLTLLGQMEAAQAEGNETEVRRLNPLLARARKRWLAANVRVTRGHHRPRQA
jgi:hypothetical protein